MSLFHWVTNDRFELVRVCSARISNIDFVMMSRIRYVERATLHLRILMHLFDGFWFAVVWPNMQGLHTQLFCVCEELCFACIEFLFAFDLYFCPLEHVFSDEIWYANHRDKTKLIFSLWVIAAHALLPPQALKRRNNEIELTFLLHFYRVH